MYESPITQIVGEMQTEYENHVLKAVQNVGIHVNREELVKALAYDREQYAKGYKDGCAKAIEEFAEKLGEEFSEKAGTIKVDGIQYDILTLDSAIEIMWDLVNELQEE